MKLRLLLARDNNPMSFGTYERIVEWPPHLIPLLIPGSSICLDAVWSHSRATDVIYFDTPPTYHQPDDELVINVLLAQLGLGSEDSEDMESEPKPWPPEIHDYLIGKGWTYTE